MYSLSRLSHSLIYTHLHSAHLRLIFRSRSTSDDLHQLARNDSLSCSVVQDRELIDHIACILRRVIHGVSASGDLAGVAFSQCPVEAVGQSVLAHVGEDFVVDFEGGEVGCAI